MVGSWVLRSALVGFYALLASPLILGAERVYVLRTGDEASDSAVAAALRERGFEVSLGARVSQLASAQVRLSDFHAVVALGADREPIPQQAITLLTSYLQASGGLVTDGYFLYRLPAASGAALNLPASNCGWRKHPTDTTTYERAPSPEAAIQNGVAASLPLNLSVVDGLNEVCLASSASGRPQFNSRTTGETTARPGLLINEPASNRRGASFSVSIRSRELQNPDFRRAFVNTVEWVAARSTPTTPEENPPPPDPKRIYILRSGDDASDRAVVQSLSERGHFPSLGVRASQLEFANVQLSTFHAVVALGTEGERLSAAGLNLLVRYLQTSGALFVDGHLMYRLQAADADLLRLPARNCTWLRHQSGVTSYERVDPPDPTIHNGIPPSFPLDLTIVDGMNETCLSPAFGGRLLHYSRSDTDAFPRPAVLVNEPEPKSRLAVFSTAVRFRELQNPNFRRLFVNTVEWAAAKSEPAPPDTSSGTSNPLRVYVLSSGDTASDAAVADALRGRNHEVSIGVRASQLSTSAPPLNGYNAVVMLGAEREPLTAPNAAVLQSFMNSGGRLLIDGYMFYQITRNSVGDSLRLPAAYCSWFRHAEGVITYERIDPPAPLLHRDVPPSFPVDLSLVDGANEYCLRATNNAKVFLYARQLADRAPRPAVVGLESTSGGRTMIFSAAFRSRELQTADFRNLFLNAVEWVGGQVQAQAPFNVSPSELSFIFNSSASTAREQSLLVTPATLNPISFSATATVSTGTDWLSVTPSNATPPATLRVVVNPVFLPPGTFNGEVALAAANGAVVKVPVKVTVSGTAPCEFRVSPLSAAFLAGGGSGQVGIGAPPACAWTAVSNVPWLAISSGASGSGPGTVSFSAAPSTEQASRTGTLTVAGQTFSVTQSGSALSFRLEPSAMDFRVQANAPAPESRVVTVVSSAANAAFTATASGGAWLTVAPSAGTAPGSIVVSAATANLAPGSYRGSVTVRIAGATPAEQTLAVTVTVAENEPSQLRLSPASLTLPARQGGEPVTDRVQVENRGRNTLSFHTSIANAPWLTVQPSSGDVTAGASTSLTVSGDPRGLQPGSYTGTITVSSASGESAAVTVVITVTNSGQSILLSQTGLSYTAVAQGGTVPPQSFGVVNAGNGRMEWTAAVETLSGGSWLSVSRSRGTSDSASIDIPLVDVAINPANLRPGEYHGRVAIFSPGASNSPQIASVILQVLPPGSDPGPLVRPTGLIFVTPSGASAPPPQEISISNPTAAARTYNSSRVTVNDGNWFTHTPAQSQVSPTQPTRIAVQTGTAALPAGIHRGALTLLFADGAVRTVNVLNIVPPPQASPSSKSERAAASCPALKLVLAHTSMRQDFSVVTGQGVPVEMKAADACGNPLVPARGVSAAVVVTFSNGDSRLNLVHVGNGVWTGTWRPVNPAAFVTVTATAVNVEGIANVQAEQISLTGSVREIGRTPIVTASSLVNSASFAGGPIAPGSLLTVFGTNLADDPVSPDALPLPRELNGIEVLLGDRSLPLLYVSNGQLNVQVPFGLPSNTQHQISVRRGQELSVPETVTVAESVPGIFTADASGRGQGLIFRADPYVLAGPTNPARAGEAIIIYCTGLGIVTPDVEPGAPSPSLPVATVPAPVELFIGGVKAQTFFTGLTANLVGLYQINAFVPQGVQPGSAVNVTIAAGGQTSPVATMAIQ